MTSGTRYTHPVAEGCTFEHFVWTCAAAFVGADWGPDEVQLTWVPDPYYAHAAHEARAEYAKVEAMGLDEYAVYYSALLENERDAFTETLVEQSWVLHRLDAMIRRVLEWTTPHDDLKRFMLDQLRDTREANAKPFTFQPPEETRNLALRCLWKDVLRAERNLDREKRRCTASTEYAKALAAVVPVPDTKKVKVPK